jgi:hypothetical protein
MIQSSITIKNNTVRLPVGFSKKRNGSKITAFLPQGGDTLILKWVTTPTVRLSSISKRNKKTRVSRTAINKDIVAYRSQK